MFSSNMKAHSRYPVLDAIRILACLMVVLWHWTGGSNTQVYKYPPQLHVPFASFNYFSHIGWLGVDLFFILSGAVIFTTSLEKKSEVFFRSRFLRLFPSYFLSAILSLVVIKLTLRQFIPQSILAITGLGQFLGWPAIIGTTWTLVFEIYFYFCIGIALKFWQPFSVTNARVFLKYWLFLAYTSAVLGEVFIKNLVLLQYAGYFTLGGILSISRSKEDLKKNFLLVISAYVLAVSNMIWRLAGNLNIGHHVFLSLLIVSAMTALLIFSFVRDFTGSRTSRSLTYLAKMTYPVYLLHEVFGVGVMSLCINKGYSLSFSIFFRMIVVILLSIFSVSIFDRIFTAWISKFMKWDRF